MENNTSSDFHRAIITGFCKIKRIVDNETIVVDGLKVVQFKNGFWHCKVLSFEKTYLVLLDEDSLSALTDDLIQEL